MSFSKLSIRSSFVEGLKKQGVVSPTEIQELSISSAVAGRDVIGVAKTGSGKTFAFGLPVLEKVKKGFGVQALILSPTRELALQISDSLGPLASREGLSIATIFGGVSYDPQIHALSRSEIVVGTPGRVLDHLRRANLDPSRINLVVLDEADKMVSMGFVEDVKTILSAVPVKPQVLLFGATISSEINDLKASFMSDPVVVRAETIVDDSLLEQFYYDVPKNKKFSLLVHLLRNEGSDGKIIIFCSTIRTVELIANNLERQGFSPLMIHGKLSQNRRLKVIDSFNNDSSARFLVASPVAARGIHVDDVSLVINYDLSADAEEYVHRVGRTARAGRSGRAVTLLSDQDHDAFRRIVSAFDVPVVRLDLPSFEKVDFFASQPRSRSSSFRAGRSGGSGRFGRSGGSRSSSGGFGRQRSGRR